MIITRDFFHFFLGKFFLYVTRKLHRNYFQNDKMNEGVNGLKIFQSLNYKILDNHIFFWQNIPMVEINVALKASSLNLNKTQVLPTPESPMSNNLKRYSYVLAMTALYENFSCTKTGSQWPDFWWNIHCWVKPEGLKKILHHQWHKLYLNSLL